MMSGLKVYCNPTSGLWKRRQTKQLMVIAMLRPQQNDRHFAIMLTAVNLWDRKSDCQWTWLTLVRQWLSSDAVPSHRLNEIDCWITWPVGHSTVFFFGFFFRRHWQSHCTNETVTAISAVKGASEKVYGALWGPNLSSDTPVLPCKHPNEMMSGDIFQCIFLVKKICILM